jgi:hypothetical protein
LTIKTHWWEEQFSIHISNIKRAQCRWNRLAIKRLKSISCLFAMLTSRALSMDKDCIELIQPYVYLLILLSCSILYIIISLPQSTAGHRLQSLAISLGLRLLASSSCQPFCANRHSTWPEGALHYIYLDAVSTLELVYPGFFLYFVQGFVYL